MERKDKDKKSGSGVLLGALAVGGLVALGAYLFGKENGKEEKVKEIEEKKLEEKKSIKEDYDVDYEEEEDVENILLNEDENILCPISLSKFIYLT